MINSEKFQIVSLQISIFTPTILFSKNKILEKLMSKFSEVFDGDVVSIPLPDNAPKEIPKIILNSANKKIKLEIADNRTNFFRYRQDDDEKIDLDKLFPLCIEIFTEYKECTQAIIGRLAIVTVKFVEDNNPGLTLAQHFCQERWLTIPFNRPENFEIHAHKKYPFENFNINSWVRCKTGFLMKNATPIILVTQDINTLAEEAEGKDFSIKELIRFLKVISKEQGHILGLYFPVDN